MEKIMYPSKNTSTQVGPSSPPPRFITLAAPVVLALQTLVTLIIYPMLPNIAPSHWDATGHINAYSAKWSYAALLPLFSLGLYLIFQIILAFGPKLAPQDWSKKRNLVMFIMVAQQVFFLIVQTVILAIALHA
jgi:uncharacterized membrane protein